MTRRLYHDDSTLRRFDATVVGHATHQSKPAVLLDHTAFYAEAGGQLGDRGTLGGAAVVDTQYSDDDQTILHLFAEGSELPAIGASVAGDLDWMRRRQHMAQHTAQHLLSGTLLDRAQAPTVSARLGESSLTIDVTRDRVPEAELVAAEDLANDLIDDDLVIRSWCPDAGELAALKLRRDPKVAADIRVVAIGDFDFSPCGGTHCARTSQLGAIRIVAAERYKGMTRGDVTAARKARAELFAHDAVLRQLATLFSCAPDAVPAAIEKLKRGSGEADAQVTALRNRLAVATADQLLAALAAGAGATSAGPMPVAGAGAIVATLPGDADMLRIVAARITAAGHDALLCSPDPTGAPSVVLLQRAASSTLDCAALWKRIAAAAPGARGGGKPDRTDGRLPADLDWPTLVATQLA